MKIILFLFGTLMVSVLPSVARDTFTHLAAPIEGVYEYKAADVPYEYQQGTIELKKSGNKWTAKVMANYQTYIAQEVKVEKDQIQFKIYVEGNSVLVKLQHNNDKLTGTASSYESGIIRVVAEREKVHSKK